MTFDPADPLASVFADVIGKPAWQVRQGHGSFLMFEFGEPRLVVREAVPDAKSPTQRRRGISVRGDWHLWINCCDWQILASDTVLAHSESERDLIHRATGVLDAQVLVGITSDPCTGKSRFLFEYGTVLVTKRYDRDDDECWIFFTPSGNVFSYRADGQYSWHPGNVEPDHVAWLPLPPSS